MKKSETITIDTRSYTVNELTVGQLINIFQNEKLLSYLSQLTSDDDSTAIAVLLVGAMEEVDKLLSICSDFTTSDMTDLSPSEIKELLLAFKRVNSDFLLVLEGLGITLALQKVLLKLQKAFSDLAVD